MNPFDNNEPAQRATAAQDAINAAAAAGVPPARTADEQRRYDSLSPADKIADDAHREAAARAAARTKAIAHLPARTDGEQQAYDAMSPADKHADDDKRLAAAKLAAVESPEGRAARVAHEQAMAGNRDRPTPREVLHNHAVAHRLDQPVDDVKSKRLADEAAARAAKP